MIRTLEATDFLSMCSKMNAEMHGINWFSICSREFRGSELEKCVMETGVHFTSFNVKAYIYSFDLTNSELVERLLAKKANTEARELKLLCELR